MPLKAEDKDILEYVWVLTMVKSLPPAVAALQSSIEHIASDLHDLDSTLRNRSADCDVATKQVTLLQEKVDGHTALLEANAVSQCEILDRLAALEKTSANHHNTFATHNALITALSKHDKTLHKAIRDSGQWQTNNLNHLLKSSHSSAWAQTAKFNQLDALVQSLRTRIADLEETLVVPDASINLNDGSNLFEGDPSTKASPSASPSSDADFDDFSRHISAEISCATWDKLTTRVTTLEDAALASDESACIAIKRLSARLRSLEEENKDECNNNEHVAVGDLSTRMTNLEKSTEASIKRLDDETAALDADVVVLGDAGLASDKSAYMAIMRLSARIRSLKGEMGKHKDECNETRPAAIDDLSLRISSLEKKNVAGIERLCDQNATLDASLKSTNGPIDSTTASTDEKEASVGMPEDSSNNSQVQDLKDRTQDLDACLQLSRIKLTNVELKVLTNHNSLMKRIGALEEKNSNKQLADLEDDTHVIENDRNRRVVAPENNKYNEQIEELKTATNANIDNHDHLLNRVGALERNYCNKRLQFLETGYHRAQGDYGRLESRVHVLEEGNCGEQVKTLEAVTNATKEDHDRRLGALEGNKYDEQLKSLEAVTNITKDGFRACVKAISTGGPIYRAFEKLCGKVEKLKAENCSERIEKLNEELVVRIRALEDYHCDQRITRLEDNADERTGTHEEGEEGVDYDCSYGSGCSDLGCSDMGY
ncbi:hypothetical protein BDV97DRAFT_401511 [Delphinella strobiligena]|nr:hypothetical protein BDV97DRAFT_401511 [Delphinella strobiligena]